MLRKKVKNKGKREEKGDTKEENKSTPDQSRNDEKSTDFQQNTNKEEDGCKFNEGVSEIASKNKESAENGIEKEVRKSSIDQSRNAEHSTDYHQNSSKEENGCKFNEGVSKTAPKKKEPAGKWIENKERKPTPDQSENAEKSIDSYQNIIKEEEGCKSYEAVREIAPKNKRSAEKGIENDERKSTTVQSRNVEQPTVSHQNISKEKEGHKSNEGVSETASKNKEPAEKGIKNEGRTATTERTRSDKQSTDSHQNSREGRKSNEGVSETTSKNKEPEEKGDTKEEKKSKPDQSRNAEQSTDSYQNTNKVEKRRKSNEGVSETAPKKKSAGKRIEIEERKSSIDQSRNVEHSTDYHQNSSKEEDGCKFNKGVSDTAPKKKEPAGKRIENEERKSTPDQSENAEKSIDSYQNNIKEEDGCKSYEAVWETASKNKRSAEKGIENDERKSTTLQSRSVEQPTVSHQNSSKEKEGHKLNEGVSETASKNKEPAEKGIKNEGRTSTPDRSRNAGKSTDYLQINNQDEDGRKSNEVVSDTTFKNNHSSDKLVTKEEIKSTIDKSKNSEQPTDCHQNNKVKEGRKSPESVIDTVPENNDPAKKWIENERNKSTLDESRNAELSPDSYHNYSKENEGQKSNKSISETFSKNKDSIEKRIKNEEKKSAPDQSRSGNLPTHLNNGRVKKGHILKEIVSETASKKEEPVEKEIENKEKKSTPAQSRSAELRTDSHQNNSKEKERLKSNESLDSLKINCKEKEGHKSNENVNKTAVKNKDSVEEGIDNEDKKSTLDQSRSDDMPTDSHKSNNKEKDLHEKSHEEKGKGISEKDEIKKWTKILPFKNYSNLSSSKKGTSKGNKKLKEGHMSNNSQNFKTIRFKDNKASEMEEKMLTVDIAFDRKEKQKYISKNKYFFKRSIENEEEKSKPAEFHNAELSKIFHGKNIKEIIGNKLNKSVATSENMDLENRGFKNEDKNSTPKETSKSKLPGYSHKQNNRLNEYNKFNENIWERKPETKEFMEKGKENKVGKSTLITSMSYPNKNDTNEKEGNKSNVIVSETTSEVPEEPREHIKVGKENQLAQKIMESVRQNREKKSVHSKNISWEGKNSPNQEQNIHRANVENQTSPNNMVNIEYNKISEDELSTGQKSQTRHPEADHANESENVTKYENHSSMRNLKREENIPKRTKTSSEKDKFEGDKGKKLSKKEPDNKKKNFENKREIQNLLGTKIQADELRVEGMFCNNALMREQSPFNIEKDSQPSPESSLNYEDREYEDSLFPSQPIIDPKSKEKQTPIQKVLEHNEFFNEHKDNFPKEDKISFHENKELSLDSLPEENIALSNHISASELLVYSINVVSIFQN